MNIKYIVNIQNQDYPDFEQDIKRLERFIDVYFNDGNPDFKVDIRIVKSIDEEELDELANEYNPKAKEE